MKRVVTILLVLTLGLTVLSGCGRKPAPEPTDANPEEAAADYEGIYTNDNSDTVAFTKNADGTCAVEVSLTRLAHMTGEAGPMDGAMELVLEDPNEGEMCANFHPADDGTYTLIITQSGWDLLEEGIEFTGFVQ